jgi:hypothetical protein
MDDDTRAEVAEPQTAARMPWPECAAERPMAVAATPVDGR